jgi:hypothetical protein
MSDVKEQLYAKWDDLEQAILNAAMLVLDDQPPEEGPPSKHITEQIERQAKAIAAVTLRQLDGYDQREIADGGL